MPIETTKTVVHIWNRALHRIGSTKLVQLESERTAEAEACRIHYGDWLIAVLELVHWPFATKQSQLNAAVDEWAVTTAYVTDDAVRYKGVVYTAVQATTGDNPASDDGTYWAYAYGLGVGWLYTYALPGDFVNFIAFLTSTGARIEDLPFDIVANGLGTANVLVTNLGPTNFSVLEYTGIPGSRDINTGEIVENPNLYPRQFVDALAYGLAVDLALAIPKSTKLSNDMMGRFDHAIGLARANARNNIVEQPEPVTPSVAVRRY